MPNEWDTVYHPGNNYLKEAERNRKRKVAGEDQWLQI